MLVCLHEGYSIYLVCVSVCPSVTALAASASMYIPATNYTHGFLLGFSWMLVRAFSKNLLFKSYGVKKPICENDESSPWATVGTSEGQQLREGQLVGRMLL